MSKTVRGARLLSLQLIWPVLRVSILPISGHGLHRRASTSIYREIAMVVARIVELLANLLFLIL